MGEIWLDQSASFNLTGGSLESSNCLFRGQIGSLPYYSPSIFVQSNGIHTVQNQLLIEKSTSPFFQRGGVYHLLAGTLLSRFVDVRDRFEQTGGAHTNGQILIVHGSYRLEGGVLLSPYLFVDGRGVFTQNAGTNRADLMYMDISSVFNLQGGTLSTSNSTVSSAYAGSRENRALFVQNGGNHIVKNYLTVDAICRLQGGSLTASNITVYPDGDFFMEGGAINNPGLFTFYDGICFARGQHQNLGRLDVRLGVLARFVQALVSTLDLQNGSTVLRFQDSANLSSQWNGKLSIKNWSGSTNGGGTDQIFVGNNAQGLTTAQLARITFADPPGFPPGNYPARILANGEIVPGARPSLHFIRTSNRLVLSWTGSNQLLTATNLIGPYAPITGATSPYTNLFTDPQRYFLLRSSNP